MRVREMNKRRRAILDALTPAVDFALTGAGAPEARPLADIPGLAVTARASASTPAEIRIYGRIGGGGWLMDAITAKDIATALDDIGPGPVDVRINSGGGDVFDGVAIHSLLSRHPGVVTVFVDGLAASAASFIMLAGERIVAARNAMIMIHDGMTGVFGNRDRLMRAVDLLDKVSDNIADMYAERAGEDAAFWRAKMLENGEDGVWYTGAEALDAGLVDELTGQTDDGESDDDPDVDNFLRGWVAILPENVAARLSKDPEPEVPAVEWDRAAFVNIMKEVFA
jgi:ATP-dependent protease ClpP protease subunit